MRLHTNIQDFNELIRLTATHFSILPEFIEKDYWITLILNNLSQSSHANSVVFKGGTSLTKGYRLINRFSEDIDIALLDEKLVSLIRFSFAENPSKELAKKSGVKNRKIKADKTKNHFFSTNNVEFLYLCSQNKIVELCKENY